MKYLLDSDSLIRSKNDSYRFDRHPGFWQFLERSNAEGLVYSIERVGRELTGEDELATWAKNQGPKFFLPPDDKVIESFRKIAQWVVGNQQYIEAAKKEFLARADFGLVAHAHAHGYTVVTFEKDEPASKKAIKIPTACNQFGVPSMNIFRLIETLQPTFVLLEETDKPPTDPQS